MSGKLYFSQSIMSEQGRSHFTPPKVRVRVRDWVSVIRGNSVSNLIHARLLLRLSVVVA